MIDGFGGDLCDFTISAFSTGCDVAPLVADPKPITGPKKVCPGQKATYCSSFQGANWITWTSSNPDVLLNGNPGFYVSTDPSLACVNIEFPAGIPPSSVDICCWGYNDCNQGLDICQTIQIGQIPVKTVPLQTLCFEDAGGFALPDGTIIAQVPGQTTYTVTFQTTAGCDSTVNYPIRVRPPITRTITKKVCKGTCVEVAGEIFCDSGFYTLSAESYLGCDSTIYFNLAVIEINAIINGGGTITCSNDSIVLGSATSTGVKTWTRDGAPFGQGNSITVTQAGQYILTVQSILSPTDICEAKDTVDIGINIAKPPVSVNNATIFCGTVSVQLTATSNVQNMNFAWPAGASPPNAASAMVTASGNYIVTVTNPVNGCSNTATATVTGNSTVPIVSTTGATLTCSAATAAISATANVSTILYTWSAGAVPANAASPTVSAAGVYTVTATNTTNNCTSTATATVFLNNAPPNASASVSGNIGCTSPSVNLIAASTTPGATFSWPSGAGSTVSTSTTGTFSVTVTAPNGCTSTASATVQGSTEAPGATATGGTLTCFSTQIQLNGSSPTGGVAFSWTGPGGATSALTNPFVAAAGAWNLIVTNPANGCTSSASATVFLDNALPTATATGGTIDCSTSQVTLGQTFSPLNSTILWTGPAGFVRSTPSPTTTNAGVYSLLVTALNGCTFSTSANVVADAEVPTVTANVSNNLDCINSTATVSGGTTTSGATAIWTLPNGSNSTASTFLADAPGNYVLNVMAANGCSAVATVSVNQNIDPPSVAANGAAITCSNPLAALAATTSATGVSFFWTGPNGFTSTAQNPTVDEPGNYQVIVTTTATGCSSMASATLTADQNQPIAAATGGMIDCKTAAVTLAGSSNLAGSEFFWTGPNGFSSASQNPTVSESGIYILSITAPNGCTDQIAATVEKDQNAPEAIAFDAVLDCKMPAATLDGGSATVGATFFWTGPNGFSSNLSDPTGVDLAGNYLLTVTALNGCTATATAILTEDKAVPDLVLTGGILTCSNPSIIILANSATAGTVFEWTGPNGFSSNLPNPSVSVDGFFTAKATGANGCFIEKSIQVLADKMEPQNLVAAGGTLSCTVDTVVGSANSTTPNVLFEWHFGDVNGPIVSNSASPDLLLVGNYAVIATSPNGCTATATAMVDQSSDLPTVVPTVSNALTCSTPIAMLAVTTSAANANFEWFLIQNGLPVFVFNGPTFSNVTTSGTYQVQITAPNGCTTTATVLLNENFVAPTVALTDTDISCSVPTAICTATTATPNAIFSWSGPGIVGPKNGSSITVDTVGEYSVIVTDPTNGCSATQKIFVQKDASYPSIAMSAGAINCIKTEAVLIASSDQPVTFLWSTGAVGQFDTVSMGGVYSVTVTNTTTGCTASASATVQSNTIAPLIELVADGILTCSDSVVAIAATVLPNIPQVSFLWSGAGIVGSPTAKNIEANASGTYVLTATNAQNSCFSSKIIVVEPKTEAPTALALDVKNIRCFGETNGSATVLGATGGTAPLVFSLGGGAFSSLSVFENLGAGAFSLAVRDPFGCLFETNFSISEPSKLVVDLGKDTAIVVGSSVLLNLENAVSPNSSTNTLTFSGPFSGCGGCATFLFTPTETSLIDLLVADANGCSARDSLLIRVSAARSIFIPNIFAPDDLDNNRFFIFGGLDVAEIEDFFVYNRWGNLVMEHHNFPPNDPKFSWNGLLGGRKAQNGAYAYWVRIRFTDGQVVFYEGFVTLVR